MWEQGWEREARGCPGRAHHRASGTYGNVRDVGSPGQLGWPRASTLQFWAEPGHLQPVTLCAHEVPRGLWEPWHHAVVLGAVTLDKPPNMSPQAHT